jgi:hypothetical protein
MDEKLFEKKIQELAAAMAKHYYAKGMRRATNLIAIAVGKLDGESRVSIQGLLDQLEDLITEAENAAKIEGK